MSLLPTAVSLRWMNSKPFKPSVVFGSKTILTLFVPLPVSIGGPMRFYNDPLSGLGITSKECHEVSVARQAAGETLGQLILASRGPAEAFSPADRRLLNDLAHQAGIAVPVDTRLPFSGELPA